MPAGRAVGDGPDALTGLEFAVAVGGADLQPVTSRAGGPLEDPLPPGVLGVLGREPGLLPGTLVDPHLDPVDTAVLCPGDTATRTVPGLREASGSGTSMRDWVLTGARCAQSRLTQYTSVSSKVVSSSSSSHLQAET